MDNLDIKILEQRIGNGDEITLTRNEFYELVNDRYDLMENLKKENNDLRECKAQLSNAHCKINELKEELKK